MRDILFRGKKWETSVWDETDWIYGSLIDSGNHEQVAIYPWVNGASTMSVRQLVYARMESVKFETVGQYTGMTDKNGKRIFEGDIMHNAGNVVEFCNGGFCINGDSSLSLWTKTEVIGNIHDNPELVEVRA